MKAKTKLIATIMAMCLVISLGVIGILAVKTLNMSVGGNINFVADGVSFTIGQGTFYRTDGYTEYDGITSQSGKMQGFAMNTNTKLSDVEDEIASWTGLELSLDSQGDAVLKFNIKNDMSDKQLYVMFTVSEGTNTNDNMRIICATSELIEPTDNKNVTITFDILDDSINAGLTGFKVDLNIGEPVQVNASTGVVEGGNQNNTKYSSAKYTLDTTNGTNTASVSASENVSGEVVIMDKVYSAGQEYVVTEIADLAFMGNCDITSVIIPNTVTRIGDHSFFECYNLTSVIIPDSVITIDGCAFTFCSSLSSVKIGNGVTRIRANAFSYTGIERVIIPDRVTTIESGAFDGCSNLTSVIIHDSVTTIEDCAFEYTGLTSVIIPDSVTTIGDCAFEGCDALSSIAIGKSVTSIGRSAFYECNSLTSIILPDSVTTIMINAFAYCKNLKSVVIGNGVTSISDSIFDYCTSLETITIKATTPPTLEEAFWEIELTAIYVPERSVAAYKEATGWKNYSSIIQAI